VPLIRGPVRPLVHRPSRHGEAFGAGSVRLATRDAAREEGRTHTAYCRRQGAPRGLARPASAAAQTTPLHRMQAGGVGRPHARVCMCIVCSVEQLDAHVNDCRLSSNPSRSYTCRAALVPVGIVTLTLC